MVLIPAASPWAFDSMSTGTAVAQSIIAQMPAIGGIAVPNCLTARERALNERKTFTR